MHRMISNRAFHRAAACVIISSLPATAAPAQQIMIQEARIGGGGDNSFEPATSAPQMKRLSAVLELNETQSMLADEFLREYHRVFREKADLVRAEMNEIQEEARATGDFSVFGEKIAPLMERWARDRTALEKEMIDNVRSLLTEEQMERWPLFEREKRRMELLPDSRLGGENVDVILLTHEVASNEEISPEIAESLEQYAIELDGALQARKRTIDGLQEDWLEALGGERERMEEIWDEATRKREAVRDINERNAKLIAEMLRQSENGDGNRGDTLWRLYQERAYPSAYEETRAERLIEGAQSMESLDEDTRDLLDGLASELEQRLEPLAHRLIAELVKEEQELPPFVQNVQVEGGGRSGRAIGFTMTMGGDQEDAYSGLLRERWDASEAVVEKIKGVLTPEQVAEIQGRDDAPGAQRFMMRGLRFNL